MRRLRATFGVGLVVGLALITEPATGVSSSVPAAVPAVAMSAATATAASAGGYYCWFCEKEIDSAFNPITEQYEWVYYAECEPISNLAGGAAGCVAPPHWFNGEGEWEGGTCAMWEYDDEQDPLQFQPCDCSMPDDAPLYVSDCFIDPATSSLSQEGAAALSRALYVEAADEDEVVSQCMGIVTERHISRDWAMLISNRLKQLTL